MNQKDFFGFAQLNPLRRFKQVPETIINSTSASAANFPQRDLVKVLSWNIAKNNYEPNWIRDFQAIIKQHQPDKIFLQEVSLRADTSEILELSGMDWIFAPNLIDTFTNTYSGILIATKYDRLNSQAILTEHYEPITNTPKVSLYAQYNLVKHPQALLAANAHLINFVSDRKFQAQLQQIESVLAKHQGNIILAGDFNTWNSSRCVMLQQMAERLNLTAVSFTAKDTKKIKNFIFSEPLDRIYYRGLTQKPNSARVINHINSSDHNPLLVELSI